MISLLLSSLMCGVSAPFTASVDAFARDAARPSTATAADSVQEGQKKDSPPPLPPISPPKEGARGGDAPVSTLTPGVLPADTDPKAQEVWERTLRTHQNPDPTQRVSAFDLSVEVRYRSAANQSNDSQKPLRLRFQSPGFARLTTSNQRELVRGPNGDFLVDPARSEVIRLTASRENEQDLRQLNESVGVAQCFIAFTDMKALRIARLSLLPGPPPGLPPAVLKRATELDLRWLDVRTPDFHLISEQERSAVAPDSMLRVLIGTDPKNGEVDIALADVDSGAGPLSKSAVLMEFVNYTPIDRLHVAQLLKVYYVDEKSLPRAFRSEPTTTLGIITKSVNLRPTFKPEDFVPR